MVKFYPTLELRRAHWVDSIRFPNEFLYGEVISTKEELVNMDRLEQKWVNSEGDVLWKPIPDVEIDNPNN